MTSGRRTPNSDGVEEEVGGEEADGEAVGVEGEDGVVAGEVVGEEGGAADGGEEAGGESRDNLL